MDCIALKRDGALWAWGGNAHGQLGLDNGAPRRRPALVGGDADWQDVSSNEWSTFALKRDGSLWAWGLNNYGQPALGDLRDRYRPVRVGHDVDWQVPSCKGACALAVNATGGRPGLSGWRACGPWCVRMTPPRDSSTLTLHRRGRHRSSPSS